MGSHDHDRPPSRTAPPRPARSAVGIGGPVGSGKTELVSCLCRAFTERGISVAVVTNDVFTTEDAAILERTGVLPVERIVGVQTGAARTPRSATTSARTSTPSTSSRPRFAPELLLLESGGDNLTATFSRALVDVQIFVIDVAGGDKVPRKGGPGITVSDLLVINKTDLAPLVGADLDMMRRTRRMRGDRPTAFVSLRQDPLATPSPTGWGTSCRTARRRRERRPRRLAERLAVRTRCTTLRSGPPITLRETPTASTSGERCRPGRRRRPAPRRRRPGRGAPSSSAPLAASMVHPGPSGMPSSLGVRARVRGSLRWEPEPTILVAGCDHRATTRIDLGAGASLVWREALVLGRHDEPTGLAPPAAAGRPGRRAAPAHRPAHRSAWPGADGPAGTDGALMSRPCSSWVSPTRRLPDGTNGAVMQLADDAWPVTSLSGRRDQPRAAGDAPTAPDR